MERMLDPGPSADTPYEAQALHLPKSLEEALRALRNDNCLADGFGRHFIDYFLRIKDAEVARYQSEGDGMGAAGIFRAVLIPEVVSGRAAGHTRRCTSGFASPQRQALLKGHDLLERLAEIRARSYPNSAQPRWGVQRNVRHRQEGMIAASDRLPARRRRRRHSRDVPLP